MEKHLKVALRAARKATSILQAGFSKIKRPRNKKTGLLGDWITKYDLMAQENIINILTSAFPSYSLLAEEGVNILKPSKYEWIIDPLDGTTNFSRGISSFGISIALTHRGGTIFGIVADPMQKDYYWAHKGQGAYLNGKPIKVSKIKDLTLALVNIAIQGRTKTNLRTFTNTFSKLSFAPTKLRIYGSTALDLARVAAGKLDAVVFHNQNPWDVAAGMLLVTEAGGKVTFVYPRKPETQVLASNHYLHDQLLNILR